MTHDWNIYFARLTVPLHVCAMRQPSRGFPLWRCKKIRIHLSAHSQPAQHVRHCVASCSQAVILPQNNWQWAAATWNSKSPHLLGRGDNAFGCLTPLVSHLSCIETMLPQKSLLSGKKTFGFELVLPKLVCLVGWQCRLKSSSGWLTSKLKLVRMTSPQHAAKQTSKAKVNSRRSTSFFDHVIASPFG